MLGRVIYLCFTVFVAITLSYFIDNLSIREPMIELNCNEQPIGHGKLLAGVSGLKAIVKCNNGWMNGAPVEVKCLPVSEKRVVVRSRCQGGTNLCRARYRRLLCTLSGILF